MSFQRPEKSKYPVISRVRALFVVFGDKEIEHAPLKLHINTLDFSRYLDIVKIIEKNSDPSFVVLFKHVDYPQLQSGQAALKKLGPFLNEAMVAFEKQPVDETKLAEIYSKLDADDELKSDSQTRPQCLELISLLNPENKRDAAEKLEMIKTKIKKEYEELVFETNRILYEGAQFTVYLNKDFNKDNMEDQKKLEAFYEAVSKDMQVAGIKPLGRFPDSDLGLNGEYFSMRLERSEEEEKDKKEGEPAYISAIDAGQLKTALEQSALYKFLKRDKPVTEEKRERKSDDIESSAPASEVYWSVIRADALKFLTLIANKDHSKLLRELIALDFDMDMIADRLIELFNDSNKRSLDNFFNTLPADIQERSVRQAKLAKKEKEAKEEKVDLAYDPRLAAKYAIYDIISHINIPLFTDKRKERLKQAFYAALPAPVIFNSQKMKEFFGEAMNKNLGGGIGRMFNGSTLRNNLQIESFLKKFKGKFQRDLYLDAITEVPDGESPFDYMGNLKPWVMQYVPEGDQKEIIHFFRDCLITPKDLIYDDKGNLRPAIQAEFDKQLAVSLAEQTRESKMDEKKDASSAEVAVESKQAPVGDVVSALKSKFSSATVENQLVAGVRISYGEAFVTILTEQQKLEENKNDKGMFNTTTMSMNIFDRQNKIIGNIILPGLEDLKNNVAKNEKELGGDEKKLKPKIKGFINQYNEIARSIIIDINQFLEDPCRDPGSLVVLLQLANAINSTPHLTPSFIKGIKRLNDEYKRFVVVREQHAELVKQLSILKQYNESKKESKSPLFEKVYIITSQIENEERIRQALSGPFRYDPSGALALVKKANELIAMTKSSEPSQVQIEKEYQKLEKQLTKFHAKPMITDERLEGVTTLFSIMEKIKEQLNKLADNNSQAIIQSSEGLINKRYNQVTDNMNSSDPAVIDKTQKSLEQTRILLFELTDLKRFCNENVDDRFTTFYLNVEKQVINLLSKATPHIQKTVDLIKLIRATKAVMENPRDNHAAKNLMDLLRVKKNKIIIPILNIPFTSELQRLENALELKYDATDVFPQVAGFVQAKVREILKDPVGNESEEAITKRSNMLVIAQFANVINQAAFRENADIYAIAVTLLGQLNTIFITPADSKRTLFTSAVEVKPLDPNFVLKTELFILLDTYQQHLRKIPDYPDHTPFPADELFARKCKFVSAEFSRTTLQAISIEALQRIKASLQRTNNLVIKLNEFRATLTLMRDDKPELYAAGSEIYLAGVRFANELLNVSLHGDKKQEQDTHLDYVKSLTELLLEANSIVNAGDPGEASLAKLHSLHDKIISLQLQHGEIRRQQEQARERERKETKETKETKERKETREIKDTKEGKDTKQVASTMPSPAIQILPRQQSIWTDIKDAFNKTFDVFDAGGQKRPWYKWFFNLPDQPFFSSGWAAFAWICSIIASPMSVFVIKPLKFLFEFPFKILENWSHRNNYNTAHHVFGVISSAFRYLVSLNPVQAWKECTAPDARPTKWFGPKWGKRIGGFFGVLLSLGGIFGIGFLAPTVIVSTVGAVAGSAAATHAAGVLGAMDSTLHLGKVAAVSSHLVPHTVATAGMGLSVTQAAAETVGQVSSSTLQIMRLAKMPIRPEPSSLPHDREQKSAQESAPQMPLSPESGPVPNPSSSASGNTSSLHQGQSSSSDSTKGPRREA